MRFFLFILSVVLLTSCNNKPKEKKEPLTWKLEKVLNIKGVNPIGITAFENDIYLSDGDHNRVVKIDANGKIIDSIVDLDRPMHIDYNRGNVPVAYKMLNTAILAIPEYGRDSIAVIANNKRDYIKLQDSLDAPAGVSLYKNEIAIADFYNNRILYFNGKKWMTVGENAPGKDLGHLNYPTDVQITKDFIYVADAYNNRGQVFDKSGKAIISFGDNEKINAATGLYVAEKNIYLTDFENSRILIFDKVSYKLVDTLTERIDKPTDIIEFNKQLYITNYRTGELAIYQMK